VVSLVPSSTTGFRPSSLRDEDVDRSGGQIVQVARPLEFSQLARPLGVAGKVRCRNSTDVRRGTRAHFASLVDTIGEVAMQK
jgi:hypothetical protein